MMEQKIDLELHGYHLYVGGRLVAAFSNPEIAVDTAWYRSRIDDQPYEIRYPNGNVKSVTEALHQQTVLTQSQLRARRVAEAKRYKYTKPELLPKDLNLPDDTAGEMGEDIIF